MFTIVVGKMCYINEVIFLTNFPYLKITLNSVKLHDGIRPGGQWIAAARAVQAGRT